MRFQRGSDMATAATVERFKAAGKQQINVWVDADTAANLKATATQRGQSYGEVLRDALNALRDAPVTPDMPAASGDRFNELATRIDALRDDHEIRLNALQAAISAIPMRLQTATPATPATPEKPPSGAKKKGSGRKPNPELEARRARFLELHKTGLSPTQISKKAQEEGLNTGTSVGDIHNYITGQGLTPHKSR